MRNLKKSTEGTLPEMALGPDKEIQGLPVDTVKQTEFSENVRLEKLSLQKYPCTCGQGPRLNISLRPVNFTTIQHSEVNNSTSFQIC